MSTLLKNPVAGRNWSSFRGIIAIAVLLTSLGCGRDAEIRAYRIPKEPAPEVAAAAMQDTPPPAAPLAMQWDTPAGWQSAPNPNEMRFATFVAGEGDEAVEVAITQLGGAAGGIAANINFWRGQIGLSPQTEEQMAEEARRIIARGGVGVFVDLVGPAPAENPETPPRILGAIFPTSVNTWFIKATGASTLIEPHRDDFIALCESVRFAGVIPGSSAAAPPGAPATSPPTVPPTGASPAATQPDANQAAATSGGQGGVSWGTLPGGWTVDASPRAMSVASMTIDGDGGQAALTITPLGGSQDVLANVNRWRRQLGLPAVADLAAQSPASIDVAGRLGTLVDIAGGDQRTTAVVVVEPGQTWFYKLTGPDDLVASQRDAFEAFVRSISFDGADHE